LIDATILNAARETLSVVQSKSTPVGDYRAAMQQLGTYLGAAMARSEIRRGDVVCLGMTVEDAFKLFENVPTIARKLETLRSVGLDYIKLGQSATTLSGGEAQRVKLSKELSKRDTGRTLYILDEPTTGLHFHDIEQLLDVLHQLVDQGNTVVVIEHNLDVIKTADWIVDLGPEGGAGGGRVLVTGTPEKVAATAASHTGHFLAPVLKPSNARATNKSSPKKKKQA
jgi:excinuclease ABC subunit A